MLARRTYSSHPNHQYINVPFENDTLPIRRAIITKSLIHNEPEHQTLLNNFHLSEDIRSRPIPIPMPADLRKRRVRKQQWFEQHQQQQRHQQREINPDHHHQYPYTLLPSSPPPPMTVERRKITKRTTITVTTTDEAKYPLHPRDVTELEPPQVSKIHARAERKPPTRQDPAIDPSFGAIRKGVVVFENGHWILRPQSVEAEGEGEESPARRSLQAVVETQTRVAVSVARKVERYYDEKAKGDDVEGSLGERLGLL